MSANSLDIVNPEMFFVHLLEAASPEKAKELNRVLADNKIHFAIDLSAEDIVFCADPFTKIITIGAKGLARFWCHAYAAYVFFDELSAEKRRDSSVRLVDLRTTDRRRQAGDVLRWAVEHDIQIRMQGDKFKAESHQIPAGLPIPFAPSLKGSDEDLADELFLMALAFMIHHEIAHLRLKHVCATGLRSFEQERAADVAAADWLLSDQSLSEKQRAKRQLGTALGLGWLAVLDVYAKVASNNTHPPMPDRLFELMQRFEPDPNGYVWGFLMALVGLHLGNKKAPVDDAMVFDSAKDTVDYYCDLIVHA